MQTERAARLQTRVGLRGLVGQGAVEARNLEDRRGRRYTLALFSRRSCLHPGTRYMARGLNARASPGNEIECEQVLHSSALLSQRA